jgi:sugar lactone lactonase YvrE
MTFRFNPDGKFVNKFAPDLHPKAIAVDNQSRVYVLNGRAASDSGIQIFSNTGSKLKTVLFDRFEWVNAMALDAQNNIYLIVGDKVRKLKAVEF